MAKQNLDMTIIKVITPIILVLTVLMTGCGVNSNLMFKTPKDFAGYDSIPMSPAYEYRISPDDRIELKIYTNNGSKLIDFSSGGNTNETAIARSSNISLDYLVRKDGFAELPVIGDVLLSGKTIQEAQETLKTLYSSQYVDPFVQVRVINKRVIVFSGNGAEAAVVPLVNQNTTLMEALALAGGIAERGRSKHIKIMRQTPQKREIYLVDLSTLDGLYYADMIVQANDYIYVEPVKQISREVVQEIAPIITVISSAAVIITVITTLK